MRLEIYNRVRSAYGIGDDIDEVYIEQPVVADSEADILNDEE